MFVGTLSRSLSSPPSNVSRITGEDRTSDANDVSQHRPHRRHTHREVQEASGSAIPRTSQHELIHQLRIALKNIGHDKMSRELANLSSRSQETLVESIRACVPKVAQRDDALEKPCDARGRPLSRHGANDLEDQRRLHLKEKSNLMAEINALRQTIAELQSKLTMSNTQVQSLQDGQKVMLDAILDKSAGKKPMEHEMKRDFEDLRKAVKGLGMSRMYASSGKATCPYVARPSCDDEFYCAWGASNTYDRRLLMRMWMFRFLHDNILDDNVFGVPGVATTSLLERRKSWSIERSLGRLEKMLHARRVPEKDIIGWRRATFRCVQSCPQDDGCSEDWAQSMYGILERLIIEDAESEEIEKLKERFSKVCRTAVKIRLAMRDQDKRYRCVALEQGQLLAGKRHIADWSAVYNGKIDEPGMHIKFTLFGALVKLAEGEHGEAILVPADVAMASRAEERQFMRRPRNMQ